MHPACIDHLPSSFNNMLMTPCTISAGLMLTLGAEGALGFVVSHELVHGHHKMDHWLANLMLCTTGYMHWSLSHIAHHTQVAS